MKKFPTKAELHTIDTMSIKQLKGFAEQYQVWLPSRTKTKPDIINSIKKSTKHPTNIEIDKKIEVECPLPNSYNEKVWEYVVKEAKDDKQWAVDNLAMFNEEHPLDETNKLIIGRLERSVCEMAKEHYDYFNMRSHAVSEHGYPIDKPAQHRWEEITTGKKYHPKGLLDF